MGGGGGARFPDVNPSVDGKKAECAPDAEDAEDTEFATFIIWVGGFVVIFVIFASAIANLENRITNIEAQLVPVGGMIAMTKETPIPHGWTICDGSHGTVDMRGRFLMGAGAGAFLHKGGSNSLKLTAQHIPKFELSSAEGYNHVVRSAEITSLNKDCFVHLEEKEVRFREHVDPNIIASEQLLPIGYDDPLPIDFHPPYIAVHFLCRIA